jgi:hypothetical protein
MDKINHFTKSRPCLVGIICRIVPLKVCCSFFLSGAFEVKQINPVLKERKCNVNSAIKENGQNFPKEKGR